LSSDTSRCAHHILFQSPKSLDDWPSLIYRHAVALSRITATTPVTSTSNDVESHDPQLIHCYENVVFASRRLQKANFLHNLATAGFHLCYLLKVDTLFDNQHVQ
jgi:hypothetical protein